MLADRGRCQCLPRGSRPTPGSGPHAGCAVPRRGERILRSAPPPVLELRPMATASRSAGRATPFGGSPAAPLARLPAEGPSGCGSPRKDVCRVCPPERDVKETHAQGPLPGVAAAGMWHGAK